MRAAAACQAIASTITIPNGSGQRIGISNARA
jgi:hypothetical protein